MTSRRRRRRIVARCIVRDSPLGPSICQGLRAVKREHRAHIDGAIRRDFADSLDLDAALKHDHPDEPRWDYLLGHLPSEKVVALEVHPFRGDTVEEVIDKKQRALEQLEPHLHRGHGIARWYWAATGPRLPPTGSASRLLADKGIFYVGRHLRYTDLADL